MTGQSSPDLGEMQLTALEEHPLHSLLAASTLASSTASLGAQSFRREGSLACLRCYPSSRNKLIKVSREENPVFQQQRAKLFEICFVRQVPFSPDRFVN